ncbi:MAG: hypothetical protein NZ772_18150 [Cyanobacteria bacterium]|nr:hypothetical protein [Cyanobacteriota bacterium]MDW8200239.1 hypothetical protein [Cyanobacteriota bacterium SKYGB_h_bin112]
MANLAEVSQENRAGTRYYRSQSLISPDRRYAVYSRIQLQAQPDFTRSRVSSVLYLEHLKTGDLRIITTSSSLIEQFGHSTDYDYRLGTIAILIPVAWSEQSDRILAREFEGIFGSSMASDCAIVWDRSINRVRTFVPNHITYTTAVLLGWSELHPDRVLFRAGNLGEDQWQLWTVDSQGQTVAAPDDRPLVFGQSIISNWTGPQVAA